MKKQRRADDPSIVARFISTRLTVNPFLYNSCILLNRVG